VGLYPLFYVSRICGVVPGEKAEKSVEIAQRVREIVQPVLKDTDIELVEVRFLVERGRQILRLSIDKPGGVDLADCSTVSREVSVLLDVHNVFPKRYTLEVSSPGLDRPLEEPSDFKRNLGRLIRVSLRKSSEGAAELVGKLESCRGEVIRLEVGGKIVSVPLDNIVKAKLEPRL
jgi:ribosome maturation factor RimP